MWIRLSILLLFHRDPHHRIIPADFQSTPANCYACFGSGPRLWAINGRQPIRNRSHKPDACVRSRRCDLRQGGNAVDAAIAANATLGVIEPMMNGIGGDLFAIVYDAKSKETYGINSSGWAPQRTDHRFPEVERHHEATSPDEYSIGHGAWSGRGLGNAHRRFGKLPLGRVLRPPIYYAANGVPITERWPAFGPRPTDGAATSLNSTRLFCPTACAENGRNVPRPRSRGVARTDRRARARWFLHGRLAQKLVKFSKEQGGTMSEADLRNSSPNG